MVTSKDKRGKSRGFNGMYTPQCTLCGRIAHSSDNVTFDWTYFLLGTLLLGPLVGVYWGLVGNASVRYSCVGCHHTWTRKKKVGLKVVGNTILLLVVQVILFSMLSSGCYKCGGINCAAGW